jgi:hypothetical protein
VLKAREKEQFLLIIPAEVLWWLQHISPIPESLLTLSKSNCEIDLCAHIQAHSTHYSKIQPVLLELYRLKVTRHSSQRKIRVPVPKEGWMLLIVQHFDIRFKTVTASG